MKKLIKKILKEDQREMYLNKIVQVMKNDFPLFKNLKLYGFYDQLSEDELIYVLSEIFGEPVQRINQIIYDDRGDKIYYENGKGDWTKWKYDEHGHRIYFENSHRSHSVWTKWKYDENGNMIYRESSDGSWEKKEYNEYGTVIHFEDSYGVIKDYR
jgi:hypothetical protein